jgi:hypothetical protein
LMRQTGSFQQACNVCSRHGQQHSVLQL